MTTQRPRNRRRFSDDLKRKLCQDQDYRCMYCGRKRALRDFDIDHKNPVQRGGSDNLRNLQVLCPPCNKRKGNQTDREFRRRYREILPRRQVPPEPAIRQDVFDMVTATTDRARNARSENSSRTSSRTPPAAEQFSIRRETGFFADALKFAWPAPESDEPITGYRLQYRVVSGGPDTGWVDFGNPHEGNIPRFEAHRVPQSSKFAFRIRARNKNGWGPWSKAFSELETQPSTLDSNPPQAEQAPMQAADQTGDPPDPITEVSFERVSGILTDAVILRWVEPDSQTGLVIGYEVQFRMHQGENARDWTGARNPHDGRNPSYRFNNVPKPRVNQFSVRLRAKNDSGWGPWSQEFPDSTST